MGSHPCWVALHGRTVTRAVTCNTALPKGQAAEASSRGPGEKGHTLFVPTSRRLCWGLAAQVMGAQVIHWEGTCVSMAIDTCSLSIHFMGMFPTLIKP